MSRIYEITLARKEKLHIVHMSIMLYMSIHGAQTKYLVSVPQIIINFEVLENLLFCFGFLSACRSQRGNNRGSIDLMNFSSYFGLKQL